MKDFDPASMDLDGYALVEASAGTGKTYGITSLYLRLIMEQGLLPGNILVVTYTKAATEELTIKIRERLEGALDYLETGKSRDNDEFVQKLATRLSDHETKINQEMMRQRIHQAILRMDEAAIFTIHGFCQRMLNEFAFEANVPLKKEVITSETELHMEACREFCRTRLYTLEEQRLRTIMKVLGITARDDLAEGLYGRLQRLLVMPMPKIIPEPCQYGIDLLETKYCSCGDDEQKRTHLWLANILSEARKFVRSNIKNKKALLSVISYDDMIQELHRALVKGHGANDLAKRIKNRFTATLIDEFQDTDRLQWEIFSTIYPDPAWDRLYLIGDPKQAIYGFRGADIFTYIKAKKEVPSGRHFSLNINWRSNSELIEATNMIFGSEQQVFILDGIEYTPVIPKKNGHEWIVIDGRKQASMELWDGIDNNAAPQFTAQEISRLIRLGRNGKAFIQSNNGETESLDAGHIAVLVHSLWEAEKIKAELANMDVPAVYYGRSSIFDSPEAPELLYILNAVAAPADESAVATALGTVALGYDARKIVDTRKTQNKWDGIVDTFMELKRFWQNHGALSMIMALFHRFNVPRRLLALKGGERSLTNFRQLSELLADAEKERPGAEQLILWLKQNIKGKAGNNDEYQLRLETDEDVVKIMTYHRSKGLEFPVVFLPFLDRFNKKDDFVIYYREKDDCYVYDCMRDGQQNNDESDGRLHPSEQQSNSETMRLIYVALTRARCKVFLPVSDGRIAAFIKNRKQEPNDSVETLMDIRGTICCSTNELKRRYEKTDFQEGGCSSAKIPAVSLAAITRTPLAPRVWRQVSFSSISHAEDDICHKDAPSAIFNLSSDHKKGQETNNVFGFPKGAKAGNCIHALFEKIPFYAKRFAINEEAIHCLDAFGIDEKWADVLTDMALNVLNTELMPGMCLSGLDPVWTAKEMGFHLPVTKEEMRDYLHLFPDLERGIMKGYIDLFFRHGNACYVLDYKSNWLGDGPSDYCRDKMIQPMDEHNYWLQAAIYLRAMEQFLKSTCPADSTEKTLRVTGLFYLFVRGVGTNPKDRDCGILFITPEELKRRHPGLFSEERRRV